MILKSWLGIFAFSFFVSCSAAAWSQTGTGTDAASAEEAAASIPASAIAAQLTRDQLDALLAGLSEEDVLEVLIAHYEKVAEEADDAEGGPSVLTASIDGLTDGAEKFGRRFVFVLGYLGKLPDVWQFVEERLAADGGVVAVFLRAGGIVLLGVAAWWATRRASAGTRRAIVAETRVTAWGKINRLLARIGLDLTAIAAFAAVVGIATLTLTEADSPTRLFTVTYLLCALTLQVVDAIARLLFAPQAPGLRIAPVDDAAARSAYRWLMWIAVIATFGFLSCGLIAVMGLLGPPHVLLLLIVGTLVVALACVGVFRARRQVAGLLAREGSGTAMASALARIWFVPVILLLVVLYLAWLTHLFWTGEPAVGSIAASIGVLFAIPIADYVLGLILFGQAHGEPPTADGPPLDEQSEVAKPLSSPHGARPLRVSLRVLIVFGGALLLARIWGGDPAGWLQSEGSLGGAVGTILLTLALSFMLWQVIKITLANKIAASDPAAGGEGGGHGGQGRWSTLAPVLRSFLLAVVAVIAGLTILSALGVDIGPLLAGAGVVGIAIGFGAQSLVRDIVSGIFFMIDDAFRVGEYVEIGDLRGTVEGISVRSLRLRHHRGAIHTIPFGEMRSLTNYSRDWVIMKMEFRVGMDTDVGKVKKIIKTIGQQLLEDEEMGPWLLETLKSQGVRRVEDSTMIIGVKFTAKPGEQFVIRREAYTRIRDAFEANGIKFASKRVLVDGPSAAAAVEELEDKAPA